MSKDPAPPAPAFSRVNDDLLREILLRLPPLPSSLPRASVVCKRWRGILSDPGFLRRFRAHHRTPPMLGFFEVVDVDKDSGPVPAFTPTLAAPDRIPPARFSFPQRRPSERLFFLGCRHGLALLFNWRELQAVVWDPITGSRRCIALPVELKMDDKHPNIKCDMYNGTVLKDCCWSSSSAFKVVMVLSNSMYKRAWACLYESESGKWGDIISTPVPSSTFMAQPGVLIGNALCWLLYWRARGVLQFDADRQSLDVIQMPGHIHVPDDSCIQVLRTVDGGLGFAILSKQRIQLWARTAISDHIFRWVLQKTIELDKLISRGPSMEPQPATIVGFDEDSNVIFLWMTIGIFMIQLESMKFTALCKKDWTCGYYPYTSFYTAGLGISGGENGAEMLNNI